MSISAIIATSSPLPTLERYRWTVAEFRSLLADGYLREGSRTFLWDGEILTPMSEDPVHRDAVEILREILGERFPKAEWTVNAGHAIELDQHYLPQPDLTVLRGTRSTYRGIDPKPKDVVLLVEVANTSYPADSGAFLRKYALEGISLYWIVNIRSARIEVYSSPDVASGSYRDRRDYGLDERVPLILTIDGTIREFEAISVRDVLQDSLEDA
jgi:hypothetical protein